MRVATLARRHFDEVQHVTARAIAHPDDMVLTETCTAEVSSDRSSSRRRQAFSAPRKRSAGTPPSTFLFLPIHLSNSPETLRFPPSGRTGRPTKLEPPTTSRRPCPTISEDLQARHRAVSGRHAVCADLYGPSRGLVNHQTYDSGRWRRRAIPAFKPFLMRRRLCTASSSRRT